jgi:hypothetical protein
MKNKIINYNGCKHFITELDNGKIRLNNSIICTVQLDESHLFESIEDFNSYKIEVAKALATNELNGAIRYNVKTFTENTLNKYLTHQQLSWNLIQILDDYIDLSHLFHGCDRLDKSITIKREHKRYDVTINYTLDISILIDISKRSFTVYDIKCQYLNKINKI